MSKSKTDLAGFEPEKLFQLNRLAKGYVMVLNSSGEIPNKTNELNLAHPTGFEPVTSAFGGKKLFPKFPHPLVIGRQVQKSGFAAAGNGSISPTFILFSGQMNSLSGP